MTTHHLFEPVIPFCVHSPVECWNCEREMQGGRYGFYTCPCGVEYKTSYDDYNNVRVDPEHDPTGRPPNKG